jgi:hypothetical protein
VLRADPDSDQKLIHLVYMSNVRFPQELGPLVDILEMDYTKVQLVPPLHRALVQNNFDEGE